MAKRAAFCRLVSRGADEIEGRFDIGRCHWAPVVEVNVFAQMKNPRQRIGRFPGFGEIAVKSHLGVALEEAGEEQSVDVLRCGVGREAGVEIGGVGLQEKRERVGSGAGARRAAGGERSNEAKKQRSNEEE